MSREVLHCLFQNEVPLDELLIDLMTLFHELQTECLSIPAAEGSTSLHLVWSSGYLGAVY